jgi:hypothetical protein
MSLLWGLIDDILLPLACLSLQAIHEWLARVVARLEHYRRRQLRPRQIDALRSLLDGKFG